MRGFVGVLLGLGLIGCSSLSQAPHPAGSDSLLITHVRVVSIDDGRVLEDHAVHVRQGRIEWVGPAAQAPDPAGVAVLDGAGRFLLPGLIDMHVHINHEDELDLYLLNGVTTVANLSGRPDHLELRDRIRAGELRGPTIYTAGPTIDGDPPRNPRFVPAGDARTARDIVQEQVQAGYDFVKIYDLIQREAYDAAVAAAQEHERAIVGHIPKAIGLEGIVGGHDLIAHAEELFYTYFDNKDDLARIPEAASRIAPSGVTLCPNTGFIRSILDQARDIDEVLARPEIRYLPPETLLSWFPENNRYLGRPPEWLERNQRMYPFLLALTRALHDAGVPLVAGSDASVAGAVPGFSLHAELRDLQTAGLTNHEALRAATAVPGGWIARHLRESVPPGVIARGRRADLILLRDNPLQDLDALDTLDLIIANGRVYERELLQSEIDRRSAEYKRQLEPYRHFKQLVADGRFDAAEALIDSTDGELLGESAVNALGYYYLYRREAPRTAIALFEMNTREFPESFNTWDSLGEGFMVAGDDERAIENYLRSLELNPDNRNAEVMLERIEGQSGEGPSP